MDFKKLLVVSTMALFIGGAANAAVISFTADQNPDSDGNAVAADRSIIASLTDGDVDTFYSLGMGGSLAASIAPNLIANASLIEVTFGNSTSYPESAKVYLGDVATGTLLGELFNFASGASSTSDNGATITATPNTPTTGRTSFMIDLGINSGSVLTFLDTTADASSKRDGFDIGELSIAAVPLPASALLLLAGIGGLGAVGRRKSRKAAKA